MPVLNNNLLSLFYYFVISLVVYLLAGYSLAVFGNRMTVWELLFSIPILAVTPALFILAGRYALKSQGSSFVDFISVILVCILGLLCTPNMAFFKPHSVGDFSVGSFYFLYVAPLDFTIHPFNSTWDSLGVGQGLLGLLLGSLFSVVPTVLMWTGLRLQVRKRHSF